jgi:SAM-dependent methyltransferase
VKGYTQDSYGNSFDGNYEEVHSKLLQDPTPMVDVLADHAGAGPALELGIGTGRVARPLAQRGVDVDGIEVSANMIGQLERSATGLPVRAFHGDFAEMEPPRRYSLVYCIWSTFFYLTTREEQERAFGRVARALDREGVFIVETYLPDTSRFRHGQEVKVIELAADSVSVQFSLDHPDRQVIEIQRVVLSADGVRLHPVMSRYAHVDELDAMAGASGLRLRDRWADWHRAPFTGQSPQHVSVYEPAP